MTIEEEKKRYSEEHKDDNIFCVGSDINTFRNKKIYRILRYDRFKDFIKDEELVLFRPEKWDDPYENFFLKNDAINKDGKIVSLEKVSKDWYGNCWTLKEESDAMWRIYAKEKNGIRITTTVDKLFNAIYNVSNYPSAFLQFFIGEVQYGELSDINKILENTFQDVASSGDNKGFAKTFLIKREAFSHEKEVRILAHKLQEDYEDNNEQDLWKFKIKIKDLLIDDICLDPRFTKNDVEKYTNEIINMGIPNNIKVKQSDLYRYDGAPIKLY